MNVIKQYFYQRFRIKKSSKDWYMFDCPYCSKKYKAAVHFDFLDVKCWTCGYKMSVFLFIADIDGISVSEARTKMLTVKNVEEYLTLDFQKLIAPEPLAIRLPIGYTNILDNTYGHIGDMARNYLEGRCIDIDVADAMGVGYCGIKPETEEEKLLDFYGYIIIPFIAEGKLKYFQGRDYYGNFPKHKYPDKSLFNVGKSELIFNEDAKYRDLVIYVESAICSMTMGKECSAFGGKDPSDIQVSKIIEAPCEEVVICLDAGTKRESYKLALKLLNYKDKVRVVDLELFSLLGMGKDPNEIGKDEVWKLIKDTPLVTFKDCYKHLYDKVDATGDTFLF